jgi:hypothetical protein
LDDQLLVSFLHQSKIPQARKADGEAAHSRPQATKAMTTTGESDGCRNLQASAVLVPSSFA